MKGFYRVMNKSKKYSYYTPVKNMHHARGIPGSVKYIGLLTAFFPKNNKSVFSLF